MLIDTGGSNGRAQLEAQLARAGYLPGQLKLIVLTHGDFDHTGNAAHLRSKYGARVAMHAADWGMAERGDMFSGRKKANVLVRLLAPVLSGYGRAQRFRPDLALVEGLDLAMYGLDAQVLCLPGHSQGSVGVLTADGELFCGDLLVNTDQPALNSLIDDLAAAQASVERLRGLPITTVYPGHGQPFEMGRVGGEA